MTGIVTLLVAALLSLAVSRVALRPLDRLAALAADITTGDRGRRLRPQTHGHRTGPRSKRFRQGCSRRWKAPSVAPNTPPRPPARAETATRRFLVDATHELRTPIAGIQAAAEQLAGAERPPSTRTTRRPAASTDAPALLFSDARRAGRLVADMLDLSRVDAGLALDLVDVDVAAIVDAEADRTGRLRPGLTVNRTGLHRPRPVRADPGRLAQILSNLLDNARRYAQAGGAITIDLSAPRPHRRDHRQRHQPGHPGRTSVTASSSAWCAWTPGGTDDHGGKGLGLPIARALARAHGGDLVCLGHEGGAVFRLSLPVGAGAAGPV